MTSPRIITANDRRVIVVEMPMKISVSLSSPRTLPNRKPERSMWLP